MSISSVSASNQVNLAALFAPAQGSPRHSEHGDRDSSGDGNSQGMTVLASLLQALVQAATQPAAATGTTATTAAAAGTSSAASTTGAAAASTSSATSTTGAAAAGTSGATSTTGTTGATSTTNLVADLQSFLHDLFSALRQAGRSGHGGREHELWRERGQTSAATTPSTTAPASSTTTPAGSTTAPASSATPAAPAATSGTVTSSPATAGSTTPVAPTNVGVSAYGPRDIVSELKALVQDLSNGQASSSTGSSGGVSQRLLSNLNSAFDKLISDLSGTTSAAGTTSTAGTSAGTAASASTAGTATASASTTAPSPTSALQAFLTNFAQDLQNNGAHSLNPVGSSVNTTA